MAFNLLTSSPCSSGSSKEDPSWCSASGIKDIMVKSLQMLKKCGGCDDMTMYSQPFIWVGNLIFRVIWEQWPCKHTVRSMNERTAQGSPKKHGLQMDLSGMAYWQKHSADWRWLWVHLSPARFSIKPPPVGEGQGWGGKQKSRRVFPGQKVNIWA